MSGKSLKSKLDFSKDGESFVGIVCSFKEVLGADSNCRLADANAIDGDFSQGERLTS